MAVINRCNSDSKTDKLLSNIYTISIVLCFLSIIVRDIGASYYPVSQWNATRFIFEASLPGLATLFDLMQQIALLCLIVILICRNKNLNWLLILASLFAFCAYGLVAVFGEGVELREALFGGVPLVACLVPLFFLAGSDRPLLKNIIKYCHGISGLAFLLGIVSAVRFQIGCGWGATIGWCPARDYLAIGMSFLWVSIAVGGKSSLYFKQIGLCLFACVLSLLLTTRSWLIQPLLAMLMLTLTSPVEFRFKRTFTVALIFISALLMISFFIPSVVEVFEARIGEDTRSGQYEVFFDQVDPESLVVGNGITAGYSYGDDSNYRWFDNQFLYLAYHFGLIPCLVLGYVFCKVLFGPTHMKVKFVCLAYYAALIGLSNYYSFALNCGVAGIFIVFGGCCSKSQIADRRNERLGG